MQKFQLCVFHWGADQQLLAKRAEELGATITLVAAELTSESLPNAVNRVMENPTFKTNLKTISQSFRDAGGYPKAVKAIVNLRGTEHHS